MAEGFEAIAEEVYQGYKAGRFEPSSALNALDLTGGLRVQLALLDRLRQDGEILGGWKVGMTSGAALDRMGAGFRPFGFILSSRIFPTGGNVPLGPVGVTGIEPEIAFRIERPLRGSGLDVETIRAAMGPAIAAFELLQHRLTNDESDGATIADNLCSWGIVLGGEGDWRGHVDEMAIDVWNGAALAKSIEPGFAIDNPLESIAALCGNLDGFGLGLEAGQHVITGAFYKANVDAAGSWKASFKDLGDVEVEIA